MLRRKFSENGLRDNSRPKHLPQVAAAAQLPIVQRFLEEIWAFQGTTTEFNYEENNSLRLDAFTEPAGLHSADPGPCFLIGGIAFCIYVLLRALASLYTADTEEGEAYKTIEQSTHNRP